ncbi:MAG: CSLREA domain-containing protein [Cellvibrionaceae bacterium]
MALHPFKYSLKTNCTLYLFLFYANASKQSQKYLENLSMKRTDSKFTRVLYLFAITCLPLAAVLFSQTLFAAPEHLELHAVNGTTITVNTTNDELNSDGDCSLREAIQAANTDTAVDTCPAGNGWDTIQVPAGTYQLSLTGADEDSNATGDLDILESVNIIGAGSEATILDGVLGDRILHVDPADAGVTLDLQKVAIINGKSEMGGGLKANNGVTFIRDSSLSQNEAITTGGAIHIDFGLMHVFSTTIENNSVMSSTNANGGGIYSHAAVIELKDSTVQNNIAYNGAGIYADFGSITLDNVGILTNTTYVITTSTSYGGGIYIEEGYLEINSSEIAYNRANSNGEGGGVYADGSVMFNMHDSWVHHNYSEDAGGGLHLNDVSIIKNSTIEFNSTDLDSGEGGGIFLEYDLLLENSTIAHNSADEGGGIYQYEYGSLIISNTVVYSNTAYDGGGVYQYAYAGTYSINSIFEENVAENDGGAIYMYDEGGVYVENSAFLNNRADEGGAIMIYEEASLHVNGSTFTGNYASTDGGAVYLYDYAQTEIRNSTFSDNHADDNGGAIYIYWPAADIQFTTIVSNSAKNDGGGIYSEYYVAPQNSIADIQFTTIVSNSAKNDGGGIYSEYYVAPQNSIIAGNSANGSKDDPTADCQIDDKLFSGGNNLFGATGGCTATRYDDTVTHASLFNTVLAPLADNGGPLLPDGSHPKTHALLANSPAVDAANSMLCLKTDQAENIRPQGNGCDIGAIESAFSAIVTPPTHHTISVDTTADELNTNGACSLREAIVAANTDTAVDSCVAGDGWDTILLPAGTFKLTQAGAITTSGDLDPLTGDLDISTTLTIQGVSSATTFIDGNLTGRVIDVDAATVHLTHVTIQNGDASKGGVSSEDGGCIHNYQGFVTVFESTVAHCTSNGDGGAIYTDQGITHILDSLITESHADEGGGIFNYYGVVTVQDSQIMSNTADSEGGGVGAYVGSTRIDNSDILSNTVQSPSDDGGGGIYHDYGSLILENGTDVSYNKSASYTGGVYVGNGLALIKDSFITHNFAKDDGGGLYTYDAGAWIQNSLIANNRTEGDGGGVYSGGIFQNNIISGNVAITTSETITTYGGGLDGWGIFENNLFINNQAHEGGGIAGETLFLINTTVISNAALKSFGGGLSLDGYGAYLENSTVQSNTVVAGQNGAGIYAEDATLVARNSTISGNSGAANGGGIYSLTVVDLQNTTVSGNSAGVGGGIWVSGTLAADFSTIAANTATATGGGIVNMRAASIMNSIVAGNRANSSLTNGTADCSAVAPFTFIGYSLFGDGTGCEASGPSDQKVDPTTVFTTVLFNLTNNPGKTATHPLPQTSPAIDAANSNDCLATDQRGILRPQYAGCDMGAHETEVFQIYLPIVTKTLP